MLMVPTPSSTSYLQKKVCFGWKSHIYSSICSNCVFRTGSRHLDYPMSLLHVSLFILTLLPDKCIMTSDTKKAPKDKSRKTLCSDFQPQCNYECHQCGYSSENYLGDFRKGIAILNIMMLISLFFLL